MPLTPSPILVQTVNQIQQSTGVMRWSTEDFPGTDRSIIVGNLERLTNDGSGVPVNAIEFSHAGELYDLAQALLNQVEWLSHVTDVIEAPPQPAAWVVAVTTLGSDGEVVRIHGPLSKFAADAWADMEWQNAEVINVSVTQLQQPPLV